MSDATVPPIVLASRSPRRAELLERLGLEFEIVPAEIDEGFVDHEMPADHCERLAREKAVSVTSGRRDSLVLGSDTIVLIGRNVLNKPRDEEDAVSMLMQLSGRTHEVYTGVAVAYDGRIESTLERVQVRFRNLDRELCEGYVATGEPMDKAGAYGIQGFGSALVERIDGDYFAVMGLPVVRTLELFRRHGFHYRFRGLERLR